MNQESLSIPVWWKPGGGQMYRREDLPGDHPEHIYNYIKREHKVEPEDYGIEKPYVPPKICSKCGHPMCEDCKEF